MAVKLHKRIQVNLPVKSDMDFYCFHNIPETTLFPLLWVDEGANIDQVLYKFLKPHKGHLALCNIVSCYFRQILTN
jgi:hypothetical protein